MTMMIEDCSGQFWTGECFGVAQAAEEYSSYAELPVEIVGTDDDGGEITLSLLPDDDRGLYYPADGDDAAEIYAATVGS